MDYLSFQLGISSSQLTSSIIFQRGRAQPATSHLYRFQEHVLKWPCVLVNSSQLKTKMGDHLPSTSLLVKSYEIPTDVHQKSKTMKEKNPIIQIIHLNVPLVPLPSGKRLHNYGKSPFFMGKLNYFNGHSQ